MILALLAQAAANNDDDDLENMPPEVAMAILGGLCCLLLVALIVYIFFFLTLSRALNRCHWRNRTMEPGQVWLNFIPLFNIVWQFITVNRVADSLHNEFRDRGWDRRDTDYGRAVGTAFCILNVIGGFINGASNIEPMIALVGLPVGVMGLVCFIIYWVRIATFSRQLLADFDDEYEDEGDNDGRDNRSSPPRRDEPGPGEHDDGFEDSPWERR